MDKKQIKVNGKPYDVKYTFAAYLLMHEKQGVNVFDLPEPTPRMIAVLIWGAIIHVEPTITPDDIAMKISMEEATEAMAICLEAILNSLPKKAKVDAEQKPA